MSGICKANQRQSSKHKSAYKLYRDSSKEGRNRLRKMVRDLKLCAKKGFRNQRLANDLRRVADQFPMAAKALNVAARLDEFNAAMLAKTNHG